MKKNVFDIIGAICLGICIMCIAESHSHLSTEADVAKCVRGAYAFAGASIAAFLVPRLDNDDED